MTVIRDYGCGQVLHNGSHCVWSGEHWLFGRIDRGMTVDEARADHADDCNPERHPDIIDFAKRWSRRYHWKLIYQLIKRRNRG